MLNANERREIVEDGRSEDRRAAFRQAERSTVPVRDRAPLDAYLALLSGYQALFGPMPVSREPTAGRVYRL